MRGDGGLPYGAVGALAEAVVRGVPARAGNRRFRPLSALRAHTNAPYKMDFHRKTLGRLTAPRRPGPSNFQNWYVFAHALQVPCPVQVTPSHGETSPVLQQVYANCALAPSVRCTCRGKVPYYTASHTTPRTTLHVNKNREDPRQRKLPSPP